MQKARDACDRCLLEVHLCILLQKWSCTFHGNEKKIYSPDVDLENFEWTQSVLASSSSTRSLGLSGGKANGREVREANDGREE